MPIRCISTLATARNKADQQDKNFQGFGRFTTGSTGEYYFRTIKPVPYPGRPAPHIHVKVKKGGRELLTTQINIAGHPGNDVDHVVLEGLDLFDRELLCADFKPIKGSKSGELQRSSKSSLVALLTNAISRGVQPDAGSMKIMRQMAIDFGIIGG